MAIYPDLTIDAQIVGVECQTCQTHAENIRSMEDIEEFAQQHKGHKMSLLSFVATSGEEQFGRVIRISV